MSPPSPLAPSLLAWYALHGRHLPWRETRDPYRIWISEIILQQTRVAQGTEYYLRLVERFPDVAALAAAGQDQVMKYWQGLGYYSRARNLHAAARIIVEHFNGHFPRRHSDVLSLPGVGDYTAAAICSIAYDMPVAVVDGNVYRVLARYFDIDTPADEGAGKRLFARLADEQLDREHPGTYNQALMDFGALQCIPGTPDCSVCPLQAECAARKAQTVARRPVKNKRTKLRPRYLHYFFLSSKGKIAVRRRNGKDIWRGLYELPLAETPNEVAPEDLLHDIRAGGTIPGTENMEIAEINDPIRHVLSHRTLHIRFYRLRDNEALSDLPDKNGYEFVTWQELSALAFPRPIAAYLDRLRRKKE